MSAGFPTSPEELSAEWLTEQLRQSGAITQATVCEFQTAPLAASRGATGSLHRVSLRYEPSEEPAPDSLIAKFASPDASVRKLLNGFGLYEKEVAFYSEIGAAAEMPAPRCHFAAYDPEMEAFALLLEDLAPALPGDVVEGATPAQARTVVKALARFHARWWNDEALPTMAWLTPREGYADELRSSIRSGLAPLEAELGESCPNMVAVARIVVSLVDQIGLPGATQPYTLIHGDFHLDNIFFPSDEGGRFAAVDWQVASLGPGMQDLARFIASGLPTEERRAHEDELLALYVDSLAAHGVSDYPLARAEPEYVQGVFSQVALFLITSGRLARPSDRSKALVRAVTARIDAAVADLGLTNLLSELGQGDL